MATYAFYEELRRAGWLDRQSDAYDEDLYAALEDIDFSILLDCSPDRRRALVRYYSNRISNMFESEIGIEETAIILGALLTSFLEGYIYHRNGGMLEE